jgi:DNA-binding CsgD family transcriptional regulator
MVTHEYVQADIGPLGLGRTSQFPLSAVTLLKAKTIVINDLAAQSPPLDVPTADLSYLIESGFRSLLGTPISHHGVTTGVIVVVNAEEPRQWSAQEIELLEIVAAETAMALNHAQSFAQLKDQLFHMNLLGTLTQQLTNALDLASRSGRAQSADEAVRQLASLPPLSLRELEVLKLIAQGLANREIAQRLFLTESTVELHASRIRKKLKLKSRTALVKYACDNHLV